MEIISLRHMIMMVMIVVVVVVVVTMMAVTVTMTMMNNWLSTFFVFQIPKFKLQIIFF